MTKKKIAFHTLGCKLNFSETSTISRQFSDEDFERVGFDDPADVYVINSCSVTSHAEKRCKSLIRQVMRKNPEACVAVIGCYSQINPEALKAIPGVGLVLGSAEKFNLFEHIKRLSAENALEPAPNIIQSIHETDAFVPSWSADDRTRTFFKIQDGCDYFCTYCTIPMARGRSRSDSIQNTLQTAAKIARSGTREIVLSGVNIGDFGRQHNETLYDLLKQLILIDGLERIRISSVEPDLLHNNIIDLVADTPRLMPHFHIPLQSGSDAVLKDMGRRYSTSLFSARVEQIREKMPMACIAVDLIVGFPTETKSLFEESMAYIRDTNLSYVHVFTYSERDNTRANTLRSTVNPGERHRRSQLMHQLSAEKKNSFYLSNKGSRATVLWENESNKGFMYGFTENYIKAKRPFDPAMVNKLGDVELNIIDDEEVYLIAP